MTTAIIADDEPYLREMLREQLESNWPELKIIAEAGDGAAALRSIQELAPDVAFLDIRMPEMTGLEVAASITAPTRIVFVTGYNDHAEEAFELNAVYYLRKPVDEKRLRLMITRLQEAMKTAPDLPMQQMAAVLKKLGVPVAAQSTEPDSPEQLDFLTVEWRSGTVKQLSMIHIEDVRFFQAQGDYTRVVTDQVDGLITKTLTYLLDRLNARWFVRCHRGYIVNRRHILTIHSEDDKKTIELRGHVEKIPVSLKNHPLFKGD